jgi:uncharacterized surface protein with fasciclin (FAS1) repeats
MFRTLKALLVVGVVLFVAACGSDTDPAPNIVDILVADPKYSILVEAVVAAGLAGTLSGPGPLTVFAPTNAALVASVPPRRRFWRTSR